MDFDCILAMARRLALPSDDLDYIAEQLEYNEWGLAFEVLREAVITDGIPVTLQDYLKIEEIGRHLGMGLALACCTARVVRIVRPDGEEFSVRGVCFDQSGMRVTYTRDALSPTSHSLVGLQTILTDLLSQDGQTVFLGEHRYQYSKADIQEWIKLTELYVATFHE